MANLAQCFRKFNKKSSRGSIVVQSGNSPLHHSGRRRQKILLEDTNIKVKTGASASCPPLQGYSGKKQGCGVDQCGFLAAFWRHLLRKVRRNDPKNRVDRKKNGLLSSPSQGQSHNFFFAVGPQYVLGPWSNTFKIFAVSSPPMYVIYIAWSSLAAPTTTEWGKDLYLNSKFTIWGTTLQTCFNVMTTVRS